MKKALCIILAMVICFGVLAGCGNTNAPASSAPADNKVVIYSSDEDYINEYFQGRLNEQFPDYDITIEYLSTGDNAAKLKAEGTDTACDIVWGLEVGYLDGLTDILADISDYDDSIYVDDMRIGGGRYLVAHRYSGCIAVNTEALAEKGIPVPTCYEDLLDPVFKNQIEMPNPKSSGTGYIFLKSLVNAMGEEEAFAYFDQLSENMLQYTSSGSGPINALVSGEITVAMGMTSQATIEINNGQPFQIIYFEEGAPYTACGYAIIAGKETSQAVKDVFDFFYSTLIYEEKELYLPEQIFVGQENNIENYPNPIPYSDMTGNNAEEKTRLLDKWVY